MPRRPPLPPLPDALRDHNSRVLTLNQWAEIAGISVRTAKRLFALGDGPRRVQLSAGRVGITVKDHMAWLETRTREREVLP